MDAISQVPTPISKRFQRIRQIGIGRLVTSVCFLAISGSLHQASAQAVYGSIYGTVTDNTGAVVPNAPVTVTDISKGTSATTQTNGSGQYAAQHLIPDTYKVEVSAPGFNKATIDSVSSMPTPPRGPMSNSL